MNTALVVVISLIQLAWLWALIAHLKSDEIDATDKICWTVVLCVLNALGLLLYLFFGPKSKDEYTTEEELKQALNEGRR